MSTVLVVDDDEDIREMLEAALMSEGYTVVTAANGKLALDRLAEMHTAQQRPCLIVLDLMMPVMNGVDFLSRLHGDPALAPLPVLVMSAFDNLRQRLPVDVMHLKKPIEIRELLTRVESHCGSPGV